MTTLNVGDIIEVAEQDYKFGTGRLILKITRLVGRHREADGEWLDLEGLELRTDGTPISRQPRLAAVRMSAARHRGSRDIPPGTR